MIGIGCFGGVRGWLRHIGGDEPSAFFSFSTPGAESVPHAPRGPAAVMAVYGTVVSPGRVGVVAASSPTSVEARFERDHLAHTRSALSGRCRVAQL